MPFLVQLIVIASLGYVQSMAFTAVSRSRNSGNPKYHRKCAYISNGIWFISNVFVLKGIWESLESNNIWNILLIGFVYTISTSEGSVAMMRKLLKLETGSKKVGANPNTDGKTD